MGLVLFPDGSAGCPTLFDFLQPSIAVVRTARRRRLGPRKDRRLGWPATSLRQHRQEEEDHLRLLLLFEPLWLLLNLQLPTSPAATTRAICSSVVVPPLGAISIYSNGTFIKMYNKI